MNVLGVGAPAPASLSSSALHFRLKVTQYLAAHLFINYHSRTVCCLGFFKLAVWFLGLCFIKNRDSIKRYGRSHVLWPLQAY